MVRSTRCRWDFMNIIRLGYISRNFITRKRPKAWKSLESSAWRNPIPINIPWGSTWRTLQRPWLLGPFPFQQLHKHSRLKMLAEDVECNRRNLWPGAATGARKTIRSYSATDAEGTHAACHNRDGHFLATLSALLT